MRFNKGEKWEWISMLFEALRSRFLTEPFHAQKRECKCFSVNLVELISEIFCTFTLCPLISKT